MSKWRSVLLSVLCLLLIVPFILPTVYAEPDLSGSVISMPSVSAQSAILIETESGARVYDKQADEPLPMASTTKIMTALVALEQAAPDLSVTVPADAVGTEGSSVYLVEGETLTLEHLLYALLLESANDAAVTIAYGIAGSVEAFSDLMNEKAKSLGLTHTRFSNPHGLDDDAHYTTAYELALITKCALENELFRTIVSTRKTTIPHAGIDGVRLLVNHNKMLRLYDGCIGVKTGFTKKSGRCLVSAAERDGVELIAVTLHAPDDWDDHQKLLDYGFSKYQSVTLCTEDQIQVSLPIVGGIDTYVMLSSKDTVQRVLPQGYGEIECAIRAQHFEYAPVREGDELGKAVFLCDTDGDGIKEVIGESTLTACYMIEQRKVKKSFWKWICSLFGK